jgi:hypothetical protein
VVRKVVRAGRFIVQDNDGVDGKARHPKVCKEHDEGIIRCILTSSIGSRLLNNHNLIPSYALATAALFLAGTLAAAFLLVPCA